MRRLALLMIVAPLAALSACNAARGPAPSVGFEPAQANYIRAPGKGVIAGQAFLRDRSGRSNVRYAAGETVRLIPATTYAQARIKHFYGSVKFVPAASIPKVEADAQYAALTRTTKTEADGRFTFQNVAPGRYYLTTQLVWTPKDASVPEGGAIYEEVTLTGNESGPLSVILSGD
ncbi:carboxypeptidase-like regulatory domain-containing protein [Methylocystis sp. 9N]|uniref:Carboxypeptidase-like regulatory domain-containing protein n=1 Tax=Methylocystis borbori TaxID=3118750 RepID=A0ABU7XFG9_9HYPH